MADFDLFVIGGGSGGVACARRAASHGARVALCEDRRVGGTCVIRGCIPKKLMRYGAWFGEQFQAAKGYGWETGQVPHDWRALITARNTEIDRLNGIYIKMLQNAGVTLIEGRGEVRAAGTVTVGGETFTAEHILIAVGAQPSMVDFPGIEHAITSDEALENLAERPARMAVLGAGYVGVELASICNGLGVETSLIFRKDLPLAGFDDDVRKMLAGQFAERGLKLRSKTTISGIERRGEGLLVATSGGPLEVDAVLVATGRDPLPNTTNLGLEALGVAMDEVGAICIDKTYATRVPGLHAVGDASDHAGYGMHSGVHDLTPVAIAEGRALAERLFNDRRVEVNYETIPTAVFGLPEAGVVGISEQLAIERGHEVAIFKTEFRPLLHTLTGEHVRVLMKLVVDRASNRVLGCHMVGDDAAEIIQGLAVAMTAGATKADFDDTVGLHPSAAEEFVTMYQESA